MYSGYQNSAIKISAIWVEGAFFNIKNYLLIAGNNLGNLQAKYLQFGLIPTRVYFI